MFQFLIYVDGHDETGTKVGIWLIEIWAHFYKYDSEWWRQINQVVSSTIFPAPVDSYPSPVW